MRACKTKLEFPEEPSAMGFCGRLAEGGYGWIDFGPYRVAGRQVGGVYLYLQSSRHYSRIPAFLSILLVDQGMDTVEIAIGDNLLVYPWIKKFVRVNKSFIVLRALDHAPDAGGFRTRMSRYMHYTIAVRRNQSIWIAQREGRAKDSNDRTQDSVLKMLAMGGEGDVIDRLNGNEYSSACHFL